MWYIHKKKGTRILGVGRHCAGAERGKDVKLSEGCLWVSRGKKEVVRSTLEKRLKN